MEKTEVRLACIDYAIRITPEANPNAISLGDHYLGRDIAAVLQTAQNLEDFIRSGDIPKNLYKYEK